MAAQTRSAAEGLGLPVDDDPIGHDLKVANSGKPKTVERNGRTWHLGDGNTVSWINRNTRGRTGDHLRDPTALRGVRNHR